MLQCLTCSGSEGEVSTWSSCMRLITIDFLSPFLKPPTLAWRARLGRLWSNRNDMQSQCMQRYFWKWITTSLFDKVATNPNYPSKNPNTFYHNYLNPKTNYTLAKPEQLSFHFSAYHPSCTMRWYFIRFQSWPLLLKFQT